MENKTTWLVVAAIIVVLVIVGFAFWGNSVVNSPTTDTSTSEKVFTITGVPFSFTPDTITVNQGDRVKIIFINNEGFHDWVLDEFNVRTPQINAGEQAEVNFVADRAGTFEYYCSVGNHRAMGMVGTLVVQ